MLTRQRLELLDAIEQTPEEYIPELLNFVHFFQATANPVYCRTFG